ncbi:MAG: hypothetical protein IH987_09425 [Planctomycetes bacterium]|nr:hypothetical protein [Planctomycetota bacterium]
MYRRQPHHHRCILFSLAAILVVSALGSSRVTAQLTITEIIDRTGDGADNILLGPSGVAVDAAGNVYVAGGSGDGRFQDHARLGRRW